MVPSKRAKKRPFKVKEEDPEIQHELVEMEDLLQKLRLTSGKSIKIGLPGKLS